MVDVLLSADTGLLIAQQLGLTSFSRVAHTCSGFRNIALSFLDEHWRPECLMLSPLLENLWQRGGRSWKMLCRQYRLSQKNATDGMSVDILQEWRSSGAQRQGDIFTDFDVGLELRKDGAVLMSQLAPMEANYDEDETMEYFCHVRLAQRLILSPAARTQLAISAFMVRRADGKMLTLKVNGRGDDTTTGFLWDLLDKGATSNCRFNGDFNYLPAMDGTEGSDVYANTTSDFSLASISVGVYTGMNEEGHVVSVAELVHLVQQPSLMNLWK